MARRKRFVHIILGIFIGIFIGHFLKEQLQLPISCTLNQNKQLSRTQQHPVLLDPLMLLNETITLNKSLIFVGVMTAAKYLETRAKAVYETWGRELPGKIAFFSSQISRSNSIPLVALNNVDDSYPPQKKSFMMLEYMYQHFGDQFEWFLRADDDVYIRAERLEVFLRSIDSSKPQFIGQAGRGNNEEFGLLSLEYDENFCMGGPGIIMSRETLKRIAPHIRYCLNNLYTNHEDVEVGRCVQKFAGIPCTWSYEMQSILYHNQSGMAAFTGNLKTREVHRAITLHPVKQPSYMYRLHNYFKELKIQALKQAKIQTHRDIIRAQSHLHLDGKTTGFIAEEVLLHDAVKGSPQYLGDTNLLGVEPGLKRHQPKNLEDVLTWNFIARSFYSASESNPRKKIDSSLSEGINDVIMEVMETINMYSKQRGRIIDFKEILYAYSRLDPLHGVDWVLDLLLVYKKYRGHKMTVPVRRHAYVQQTFTDLEIREISLDANTDENNNNYDDELMKYHSNSSTINNQLKINFQKTLHDSIKQIKQFNFLPFLATANGKNIRSSVNIFQNRIINMILPLSGRFDTFERFLNYFEDVCVKNNEPTRLYIILYENPNDPNDFQNTLTLVKRLQQKYNRPVKSVVDITVVEMLNRTFSRGEALQVGASQCLMDDLLFFIDVDIIFRSESLMKVRLNTVKHKQVYFPIVFSEYNPNFIRDYSKNRNNYCSNITANIYNNNLLPYGANNSNNNNNKQFVYNNKFDAIQDRYGYWRLFGYGIMSAYKCDLDLVGGFNTTIHGWGLEDVTLFDRFTRSQLKIFRVPDPTLRHIYHPIECNVHLSDAQKQMCLGSQASTLGSWRTLFHIVITNRKLFEYIKTRKRKKPQT